MNDIRRQLADAFRKAADKGIALAESWDDLSPHQIADQIEQGVGVGETLYQDALDFIVSCAGTGTVEGFIKLISSEQPTLSIV